MGGMQSIQLQQMDWCKLLDIQLLTLSNKKTDRNAIVGLVGARTPNAHRNYPLSRQVVDGLQQILGDSTSFQNTSAT